MLLTAYLEDGNIDLSHLSGSENKTKALQCQAQAQLADFKIKTFVLANEAEFCSHFGIQTFQDLFETRNFRGLTKISFENCKLKSAPCLASLTNLETLNLNGNELTSLNSAGRCENLKKKLCVVGNLLEGIADVNMFPSLDTLTLGSHATKYIGFEILSRVSSGALRLNIDGRYTDVLVYPSYGGVLSKEQAAIKEFVEKCELDTTSVCESEVMNWFSDSLIPYRSLKLSGTKNLSISAALQKDCFKTLKELSIENCSLECVPSLCGLQQLQVLALRNNNITSVQQAELPRTLKERVER